MATIRNASSPSRNVITNACAMASFRNEIESQKVYPDQFDRINSNSQRPPSNSQKASKSTILEVGYWKLGITASDSTPRGGWRGHGPEKNRPIADGDSLLRLPAAEVERVRHDA